MCPQTCLSIESALSCITNIRLELNSDLPRLQAGISNEKLISSKRRSLVESFIKDEALIFDVFDALDVNLFILKIVAPDEFPKHAVRMHLRSKGELFEYDPPKNGQNIVKHGLSFSEAISFSKNFGTLIVPIKIGDERRYAIFSELTTDGDTRKLDYPIASWPETMTMLTLTIVTDAALPYRVISARRISSTNLEEAVAGALHAVEIQDPIDRATFHDACAEILKRNLRCFA